MKDKDLKFKVERVCGNLVALAVDHGERGKAAVQDRDDADEQTPRNNCVVSTLTKHQ
jgi:hypothetical protein